MVPTITHSVFLATPACRFRFSNSAWFFYLWTCPIYIIDGTCLACCLNPLIYVVCWNRPHKQGFKIHTQQGEKNEQLRMHLLRPQQSNSQRHLRPLPQKLLRRLPIPVLQPRRRLLLRPLPPVRQMRQHRLRQMRGTMQHLRQHVMQRLPELLRQVRRILLRQRRRKLRRLRRHFGMRPLLETLRTLRQIHRQNL